MVASLDGKPVGGAELHDLIRDVRIDLRNKAAKAFARKTAASGDQDILVGSMELLWERLEDGSVDLFLTDPPYAEVGFYEQLAELAAAKLKPGTAVSRLQRATAPSCRAGSDGQPSEVLVDFRH